MFWIFGWLLVVSWIPGGWWLVVWSGIGFPLGGKVRNDSPTRMYTLCTLYTVHWGKENIMRGGQWACLQSTYFPRDETGLVCRVCPLSWSVHCKFTGYGKCKERGWACTPHPHQSGIILPSSLNVRQKAAVATLCTLWPVGMMVWGTYLYIYDQFCVYSIPCGLYHEIVLPYWHICLI